MTASEGTWRDWLLETGIAVDPDSAWGEREQLALLATRWIEANILASNNPHVRDILADVRAVRNFLCCARVICEGHNPWHEKVGRAEWLALTEREFADRERKLGQAIGWARNLGWVVASASPDMYDITPLGRTELARDLTPLEE